MPVTARKITGYGWRRDSLDERDHLFSVVHAEEVPIPSSVTLKAKVPQVFDQGQLGSCTANSSNLLDQIVRGGPPRSRLATYYETRVVEGTVDSDAGAELRDVLKVLATDGVGPETEWPYVISKFKHKPAAKEIKDAAKDKIVTYSKLMNGDDYRQCLAAGFPFVIGFSVYEAFESDAVASTGLVPTPAKSDKPIGGHAVCVIGYDSDYQGKGFYYLVQNSWGAEWGDPANSGCFWIAAAYLENANQANDAWTIRS